MSAAAWSQGPRRRVHDRAEPAGHDREDKAESRVQSH